MPEEAKTEDSQALVLMRKGDSIQVVDEPSREVGEALRATIQEAKKIALVAPTEHAQGLHAKWKRAVAVRDKMGSEYDAADTAIKVKLFKYRDDRRRIAEAAAHIAAERAREEAEEERLKKAMALEADGHQATADAVMAAPVPQPKAQPIVFVPRVKGSRTVWRHEIVDKAAFVRACIDGVPPLTIDCVMQDTAVLGPIVREMKERFNAPGVRVTAEEG